MSSPVKTILSFLDQYGLEGLLKKRILLSQFQVDCGATNFAPAAIGSKKVTRIEEDN